ncbi:NAD(P)/FAD-dependent oxidoreductase [Arthrobacter sp. CAN_C5]|uniref:flavin-containing monooxygenase n=1 Tax=Arthrobacter sp. CAN_C5 TaxID=2760706 RepID=UPI001AE4BCD1|nr:NAD(P)-binding domain-containing protein [Arthrobacter sp. CAN_C5]MBP2216978.1 putative flavoprotein involved in K+ transport [Arthrobacter sp. CAN_C5]
MSESIVVVGAGQAGLAIGYHLQAAGLDYVILTASDRLGASWSERWDSLRLFTPARYSGLPGSPFPSEDPWSYPSKDEVSRYLSDYAEAHELNIRLQAPVRSVRHDGESFLIDVGGVPDRPDRVVIATGPFSTPWVPPFAAAIDAGIQQLHSQAYRNPAQVRGEKVVVVGGGNSGFQIALELALAGRSVHLAERTRARTVPQRMLGRDLFWWLDRSGILAAGPNTPIGRRLSRAEPIVGTSRRQLRNAGVVLHPGVIGADATSMTFADGAILRPDAVIWATGFHADDRWIDVPAIRDRAGNLVTEAGCTSMPGLYTIGRPWQRNRGSALLGFVGADARHLCEAITREL